MLLASYKGAPVVLLILGVLVAGFGYLMRNAVIGGTSTRSAATSRRPSCRV